MNTEEKIQKRLALEEQEWAVQRAIMDLKKDCPHEVKAKGRLLFSPARNKVVQTYRDRRNPTEETETHVYCQLCDENFGWSCSKSPVGYCEYKDSDDDHCIHCGQPSERK
jgi:hypothetical protein